MVITYARPLILRVFKSSDPTSILSLEFSETCTLGNFKNQTAKLLNVNPNEVELWYAD